VHDLGHIVHAGVVAVCEVLVGLRAVLARLGLHRPQHERRNYAYGQVREECQEPGIDGPPRSSIRCFT